MDIDAGGTIDQDEWIAFFERLFHHGGDEVVEFVCGYLEGRWKILQKAHACGKQVKQQMWDIHLIVDWDTG